MIEFPANYKIRTENDFYNDYIISARLEDFQKHLSQASIDMDRKSNGQTVDSMFTEKYYLWRVYDIDGITKYKLNSGIDTFFIERQDHAQKVDDMFRKRNTPTMHVKHMWHSIKNPPSDLNVIATTIIAGIELLYNLKMCRLNKTR